MNLMKTAAMARAGKFAIIIMMIYMPLGVISCGKEKAQEKPRAAPVKAAQALQKDIPLELNAIGEIEAYTSVLVKSQISGVISKVHFREGQYVRKGDVLFTIDRRPFEAALKQAEANYARDKAQYENAKKDAARYEELVRKGYVAQSQYEQFRTSAEALEATVKADEAVVENARVQLSYCTIKSPVTGKTGNLNLDEGNVVKANDDNEMVTVYQIEPINVSFTLPEQDLPGIKEHMAKGTPTVGVSVPTERKSFAGELTFTDNAVDRQTGTIRLKGTLPNRGRELWPGQFVNVSLRLAIEKNAVVVPNQAVMTGQKGQTLFVIKPDNTAELRVVTVERTHGNEAVISKGVNPGEIVVTDGQLQVLPGMKVEIKNGGATDNNAPAPAANGAGEAIR